MNLIKNKKGDLISEHWAEIGMFSFLLLSFLVSLVINAAIVSYFVIFICGILVGRHYQEKKGFHIGFPFYMIVFGFIVGYLLGALIRNRGNILVIFLLFCLGIYAGMYLKREGFLK